MFNDATKKLITMSDMITREQQHQETPEGFKALLNRVLQRHILIDRPAPERLQSCDLRLINSGINEGLIRLFYKWGMGLQHD